MRSSAAPPLLVLALATVARAVSAQPSPPAPARPSPLEEAQALIVGKEDQPAEEVFKDIQVLKGLTAAQLLRVMSMGYARALGVDCAHCHVPGAFEKSKREKHVARAMARMVNDINTQYLPRIPDLKSAKPGVNCATCHRGQVKPATSLDPPRPPG